jgi:hypothetical protein
MSAPKAKVYSVTILGKSFLVYAQNQPGAVRNVLDHLDSEISVGLATGEQLYRAGKSGAKFISGDKYGIKDDDDVQADLIDDADTAGA